MNDITVDSLSREQIGQLDKVLDIFGVPNEAGEIPPIVIVLKAAELWFLKRQQLLRMEERSG
jgi:hypothetical protein